MKSRIPLLIVLILIITKRFFVKSDLALQYPIITTLYFVGAIIACLIGFRYIDFKTNKIYFLIYGLFLAGFSAFVFFTYKS